MIVPAGANLPSLVLRYTWFLSSMSMPMLELSMTVDLGSSFLVMTFFGFGRSFFRFSFRVIVAAGVWTRLPAMMLRVVPRRIVSLLKLLRFLMLATVVRCFLASEDKVSPLTTT